MNNTTTTRGSLTPTSACQTVLQEAAKQAKALDAAHDLRTRRKNEAKELAIHEATINPRSRSIKPGVGSEVFHDAAESIESLSEDVELFSFECGLHRIKSN